jgi:hypothetical protein
MQLIVVSNSQSVPGHFQLELSPIFKRVPYSFVNLIGLGIHFAHIAVCCSKLITYSKGFFWGGVNPWKFIRARFCVQHGGHHFQNFREYMVVIDSK